MALIKCHECSGEVSTQAASCPKCGAKVKVATKAPSRWANAIIFAAVLSAVGLYAFSGDSDAEKVAKAAQAETVCRASLQCWAERGLSKASVYCQRQVESLALHSVKWTDTTFGQRFSRYKWLDAKAGTVTYIGDGVEFQNGFGAYTPMIYACDLGDLDQATPKVLEVRVLGEGRLPE